MLAVNMLVVFALLVLMEIAFRSLLFSGAKFMESFRRAELYADYHSDDDFWKLLYSFGLCHPPVHPDALLGWVKPSIEPGTYDHAKRPELQWRIPVLFYGDSFATCSTPPEDCFHGILNKDAGFSSRYYMINYAVAGYGLDQIYLLFDRTVQRYRRPIVIISLLDTDLDRSVLTFRDGQKPYFVLQNGKLQLQGVPINPEPKEYLEAHPPEIGCYLCAAGMRMLFDGVSNDGGSRGLISNSRIAFGRIEEKKRLNRAIILNMRDILRQRNIPYLFVVFESPVRIWEDPDWRLKFLTTLFQQYGIPYMLARDVIRKHSYQDTYCPQKYMFSPRNWHPNSTYNRLIAERIAQWTQSKRTAHTRRTLRSVPLGGRERDNRP